MGLLEQFEKLINEHGSAVILREHLALVKAEQAALERKCADLTAENNRLRTRVTDLEGLTGLACDSCGSAKLKRIGNRDDPTFGILGGIKQPKFQCLDCGAEFFGEAKP